MFADVELAQTMLAVLGQMVGELRTLRQGTMQAQQQELREILGELKALRRATVAVRERELFLVGDLYTSTKTEFQKDPDIQLDHVRAIYLFAPTSNTDTVHLAFGMESSRAVRFMELPANTNRSILAPDSREHFTVTIWFKNATTAATQTVYVLVLRTSPLEATSP